MKEARALPPGSGSPGIGGAPPGKLSVAARAQLVKTAATITTEREGPFEMTIQDASARLGAPNLPLSPSRKRFAAGSFDSLPAFLTCQKASL